MRWILPFLMSTFFVLGAFNHASASALKNVRFASSVTSTERSTFRSAVKSAPRQLQRMLERLPVPLRIEARMTKRKLSFAFLGGRVATIKFDRSHLRHRMAMHVIWHEIGHVLHYEGIRESAEAELKREFKKSKSWRSCFPMGGRCVPFAEVLADQIAFWATGKRHDRSSYRIPPLASSKAMGKLMDSHYTPEAIAGMRRQLRQAHPRIGD